MRQPRKAKKERKKLIKVWRANTKSTNPRVKVTACLNLMYVKGYITSNTDKKVIANCF